MIRIPLRSANLLLAVAVAVVAACSTGASDKGSADSAAVADSTAVVASTAADTDKALIDSGTTLLYTKKDPNTAVTVFTALIARNPTHYGAHYQLAVALDSAGRVEEAKQAWQTFLPMAQQAKDSISEATAQRRLSAPPGALTDAQVMNNGLYLLITRNDPAAAEVQFRKLLAKNPNHYGATYQLATALDRQGKAADARPLWQKVLKMAQETKDQTTINTAAARLLRNP